MEIPKGLYKQKNSKMWWTCMLGQRETTGTADLKEAIRILNIRKGRAAEGQPILRRLDRIIYDEAKRDLIEYYEMTGDKDVKEAG